MVAILMTNLSKISEDFVLWSTSEFSFIELSDEFTSPSSVMPQKKNPDILELTRGKTAEIIGNLTAILSTIKGLSTGYGRDLQQIKSSIWSTSKTSIGALLILKSMLLTLHVNEKQMKKATDSSYLIALDIAEKLVLKFLSKFSCEIRPGFPQFSTVYVPSSFLYNHPQLISLTLKLSR